MKKIKVNKIVGTYLRIHELIKIIVKKNEFKDDDDEQQTQKQRCK